MKADSKHTYRRLFEQVVDPEQEEAAIGEVYVLCEQDFSPYIRKYVPDEDTVADILSELMETILLDVSKISQKIQPKDWLFGILRNLLRNYLREVKKMPIEDIELHLDMGGGIPADAELNYRDLEQVIIKIIADMSPKRAEVFLLRWEQDLSNEEIATRCGKSIHTVKIQLKEAIDEVGQTLERLGFK